MYIPRFWTKASGNGTLSDGRTVPVSVWGWGDDDASAKTGAADRLQRVVERMRRGDSFPHQYGYGNRPLKEEILQTIDGSQPGSPAAIISRNGYGAKVMNASRLLFLDIDLPPAGSFQGIRKLFGAADPETVALDRLRDALRRQSQATFRVYRTASGLRAIAIDREFEPGSTAVQQLMQATKTDPEFSKLCLAQKSFRARLTPKPWRINCGTPPGQHPRHDADVRVRFAAWLTKYEKLGTGFATCRYLETIGSGQPSGDARWLLDLHDRETRCNEDRPLA